jgi:hypothetical protein
MSPAGLSLMLLVLMVAGAVAAAAGGAARRWLPLPAGARTVCSRRSRVQTTGGDIGRSPLAVVAAGWLLCPHVPEHHTNRRGTRWVIVIVPLVLL